MRNQSGSLSFTYDWVRQDIREAILGALRMLKCGQPAAVVLSNPKVPHGGHEFILRIGVAKGFRQNYMERSPLFQKMRQDYFLKILFLAKRA